MLIGYARVSTDDQNLSLQKDALLEAGCERIFEDHLSGAKSERLDLSEALEFARVGDTLAVLKQILDWSKDRPLWQRDALRRLVLNGTLSDDDIRHLADLKEIKGLQQ